MDIHALQAHGWCFLWNPELITLHVLSDATIALCYFAISIALFSFRRRLRATDMIPLWGFRSFATFIFACGLTHVMDIVTIFYPLYFEQGVVKLVTAVASVSTAVIVVSIAREKIDFFARQ